MDLNIQGTGANLGHRAGISFFLTPRPIAPEEELVGGAISSIAELAPA
jgi:hypothetical protein